MSAAPTATLPDSAEKPICAGIVGLGRRGVHHLERLSLRADIRAVAAFDVDASRAATAGRFRCPFSSTWPEFLSAESVELVLIASPPEARARLAVDALNAGKHVLVETPPCRTLAEADAMAGAARASGCLLSVTQNRRWDDDFRAAFQVVQSGALGELQTATFVTWNQGLHKDWQQPDRGEYDGVPRRGVLREFGAHYIDQLLLLAAEEPQSVYARTRGSHGGPHAEAEDAFTAIVVFGSGLTAHVEVDLASLTPRHTGWLLTGTHGGYRNFRRYARTPEGELFDVALKRPPVEWDQVYEEVAAHLRHGGPAPVPFAETRRVVAVIEAARRSAATGQVVTPAD